MLSVFVCSLGASAAAGSPHPKLEAQPPHTRLLAYLGQSRGYEIGFSVPNAGVAVLYVQKLDESQSGFNYAVTAYAVHLDGHVGDGVFRARFPGIGELALRFRPRGKSRVGHNQKGCTGPAPLYEDGSIRGAISLEGEGGYFHLSLRRAKAAVERSFRLQCRQGHAAYEDPKVGSPVRAYVAPSFSITSFNGESTSALLYALARTAARAVAIRAAHRQNARPGAEVQAISLEGRGGMAIGRSALVDGEAGTLLTSLPGVHPATASLTPPAPFHGQGSYEETSPHHHSWTGSLGVSFPGLDVPLTGPEFSTSLCVVSPLKAPSGCDFMKPKPLEPARVKLFRWRPR